MNKETPLDNRLEGPDRGERSHTFLSRKGRKHETLFPVDRRGDRFHRLNGTAVVYGSQDAV